jgi:hypothetical protein
MRLALLPNLVLQVLRTSGVAKKGKQSFLKGDGHWCWVASRIGLGYGKAKFSFL